MGRSLHLATLLLACAALAPACFLNSGAYETSGGGASGGSTTTTTTTTTGGTGGTGGSTSTGGSGGGSVCGDGKVTGKEQCDDDNTTAADGCTGCVIDAGYACDGEPSVCVMSCGDGDIDPGEDCDDFNIINNDGCGQGCKVEAGWKCANPNGDDAPSVCKPSCGDGILDAGEGCDVGMDVANDGCRADCTEEVGWDCKQPGDDPAVPSTCAPICGDGIVIANQEECDDGDTMAGDGCAANCKEEAGWDCTGMPSDCMGTCGDGIAVGAEECDDGNTGFYDGCDGNCLLEAECGNNLVEPGEECDGGNGCTSCKLMNAGGACGVLIDIEALGTVGQEGTAKTITFNGDTGQNGLTGFGDPEAYGIGPCSDAPMNETKVHKYQTGATGSMISLETLSGGGNFDKTVIWVVMDCLDPAKIDACDDDSSPSGEFSKLNVGYVPPHTWLYIAVGDNGGGSEQGPYTLKLTDQPVKLLYAKNFGGGLGDFTVSDSGADAHTWVACNEMGCPVNPTLSRSGGDYALATDNPNNNLSNETLRTGVFQIGSPSKVFVQFNVRFQEAGGVSDTYALDTSPDGAAWTPLSEPSANIAGRRILDATAALPGPQGAVGFRFNDNGGDAEFAAVDDLFVYSY